MAQDLKPGIYYDVDEATYHQWDLPHYSGLKYLEKSVELFVHHERQIREESDAMRVGSAIDCLLLSGPKQYGELFAIAPNVDRRTKAGKADWAVFVEAAGLRTVLTETQGAQVAGMAEAVRGHSVAMSMLTGGHSQVAVVWHDPETNIKCKARIDYAKPRTLVDLKSCRNVDRFYLDAVEYGYHLQTSLYKSGWQTQYGVEHIDYHIVAVQSTRPHRVKVFKMGAQSDEYGTKLFRRALYTLQECEHRQVWRDTPVIEEMEVPRWELWKEGIESE